MNKGRGISALLIALFVFVSCSSEITDTSVRDGDCFRSPPIVGAIFKARGPWGGPNQFARKWVHGEWDHDTHVFEKWDKGGLGEAISFWRVECPAEAQR